MLNEADTRAKLIDPKLQRSGWMEKMIVRDKAIAKGMIINEGGDRLPVRKPDYVLCYPDELREKVEFLENFQRKTEDELEKLIPSILDKAFKGEV
jgi:type I site-specific restriction endonuclease